MERAYRAGELSLKEIATRPAEDESRWRYRLALVETELAAVGDLPVESGGDRSVGFCPGHVQSEAGMWTLDEGDVLGMEY